MPSNKNVYVLSRESLTLSQAILPFNYLSKEFKLHSDILASKTLFESNLIRDHLGGNNSKIFHHKSDVLPSVMYLDSVAVTSDLDKAYLFDDIPVGQTPLDSLSSISFTCSDVLKILSSLNSSKAKGIDQIGPAILKNSAPAICFPLISCLLAYGQLPYNHISCFCNAMKFTNKKVITTPSVDNSGYPQCNGINDDHSKMDISQIKNVIF